LVLFNVCLRNILNNVNLTRVQVRSARSARETNFRHLGRAKRGPNGAINLFKKTAE
jgi:hypothetical protein